MPKFAVTTEINVTCKVTIEVEADTRESAIDEAGALLPSRLDMRADKSWRVAVALKGPGYMKIASIKPYYLDTSSGSETAKEIK